LQETKFQESPKNNKYIRISSKKTNKQEQET